MSTWTNSKDGIVRTDLRVAFRLSVDDLAGLLAIATEGDGRPIATLPATQVRELVLDQLLHHGRGRIVDAVDYVEITDEHRDAVRRAYGGPS